MSTRAAAPIVAILAILALAAPVTADSATVERIDNVDTVVVVALPDNFPIGSISHASCDWVLRVERPDGSATEKLHCTLTDEPVMVPEFQGGAPSTAFRNAGGACEWVSEWWFAHDESIVFADFLSIRGHAVGRGHRILELSRGHARLRVACAATARLSANLATYARVDS